ncbi:MAG TPA: pyruvate, water dikinase regulatory protein [Candidatus Ozemobacteraceae bacterium]|nr:pyruvate, water dikinase regulatory protein [Candidatus Ozemobacteraceae bacterium]
MSKNSIPLRIFVVSGGVGASAEQVVNTVLAQFPDSMVEIVTTGNVREESQIGHVIAQAADSDGIIVFTLVDKRLGVYLDETARERGVTAVDIAGPLLDLLSRRFGIEPLGRPGLYRQLHQEYFARVAAIEYTMSHDDGRNHETWHECDLLLLGVSRTGKTPLSIYLSVLGWKVANFPLVPGLPVPEDLFRLDRTHVVGLTLSPDRLLSFRRHRSTNLGVTEKTSYSDPLLIAEELEYAGRIFSKGGFELLDVTDKTVEASANELIKKFTTGSDPRKIPPV